MQQFLPKAKTIMIIVLIQGSQSESVTFIERITHSLQTFLDLISLEKNMQLNAYEYVFNGFMRQNMLKCLAFFFKSYKLLLG